MNLVWIYCRKVGDWGGNSRSGFWSWVNIFTGHFFLDHFCEFNGLEVVVVTKLMSLGRPWRLSSAKLLTLNNMALVSCPPGSSWIRRWKNCSLLITKIFFVADHSIEFIELSVKFSFHIFMLPDLYIVINREGFVGLLLCIGLSLTLFSPPAR